MGPLEFTSPRTLYSHSGRASVWREVRPGEGVRPV